MHEQKVKKHNTESQVEHYRHLSQLLLHDSIMLSWTIPKIMHNNRV
jgi:hypothetical protein